jgi:triosephosphate isomerase
MKMGGILLAGNWKMHRGPREAEAFLADLLPLLAAARVQTSGINFVLFPPTLSLDTIRRALLVAQEQGRFHEIELGIQHVHTDPCGAFTGEVSAEMAVQAGASFALVGHSERRHIFGETDAETLLRTQASFRAGLNPILCVGETLGERESGRLSDILHRQLDAVFGDPELREQVAHRDIAVAYEPVWAIGTGKTATPEDAGEAHTLIYQHLCGTLGEPRARGIPILYGGSVKPALAEGLFAAPHVRGLLVGGASLEPQTWAELMGIASLVAQNRVSD